MKEWRCIQVGHHEVVGQAIEEWEKQGWRLHTYTVAGMGSGFDKTVNHYLLFTRGQ